MSWAAPAPVPGPPGPGPGASGFAGRGLRQIDSSGQPEFEFALGAVRGMRQWFLDGPDFGTDPLSADAHWPAMPLRGQTGYRWASGVQEAYCANGRDHPPPVEECGCGFYAYWDMRGLQSGSGIWSAYYSRDLPVLGVIEGTGRTLLGEKGFRCQRAKIVALAPVFNVSAVRGYYSYGNHVRSGDPLWTNPSAASGPGETDRELEQAVRQAEAWLAVIQDRIGRMYPGAAVFATARGMLASCPPDGAPQLAAAGQCGFGRPGCPGAGFHDCRLGARHSGSHLCHYCGNGFR